MTAAIPGRRAVTEALAAHRRLEGVYFDPRSSVADIVEHARAAGVPVTPRTAAELDTLASGVRHQGVVAVAARSERVPLSRLAGRGLVVVLDGVTDPQNLGAIARSAEAAGADGMVIRSRRAAGITPAAEKAAAGALSWLPVAVVANIASALGVLSEAGAWSVGLDGAAATELWDSALLDGNVVLVIGSEGAGVSRLVRDRVDELVRIPMAGHVASLNASAAAAIALFEAARHHRR